MPRKSKLTPEQWKAMFRRVENGEKAKDLAKEIGVQVQTIYAKKMQYGKPIA